MPRANKGRGKGYRRTKNGRYEAYASEHCHFVSLGTYDLARYRKEKHHD